MRRQNGRMWWWVGKEKRKEAFPVPPTCWIAVSFMSCVWLDADNFGGRRGFVTAMGLEAVVSGGKGDRRMVVTQSDFVSVSRSSVGCLGVP